MRFSNMFAPTRKEDPTDAEVASHKLLVRGGYIRMLARGIYSFLPLGWRSIRKIEQIIREEMDAAGALEVHLPSVQPAELWIESERWTQYGPELLRFKDRKQSDFCLGPTHEEVITDVVRGEITSYKQLPVNLYQIQTKFRDEVRPRFGLMRGREFVMKDAYSFDLDAEGALKSYDIMFDAYRRICDRLGFEYRAVEADTGNIGGSRSHEFQVLADTGEDEIASCGACGYAANVEKAELRLAATTARDEPLDALTDVNTPNVGTIDEVSAFLKLPAEKFVKTLLFVAGDQPVAVLVRGDHSANEIKVRAVLKAAGYTVDELRLASDAEVVELTGAPVGFAGPVGLSLPIFADHAVESLANFVIGANAADTHKTGANWGRDFEVVQFADLRVARAGDRCGRCDDGVFEVFRGIEVGHVFYLGTKYSEAMNAKVLNENGKEVAMEMGCYGIGVTRILAAVVEQNHDDDGIIWPMAIAPYHVIVLPLQSNNDDVVAASEKIYADLLAANVDVILDDRPLRAGNKFKDADLIGIPLRIAIGGRGLEEGIVEYKPRKSDTVEKVPLDDVVARVLHDIAKY